MATASALKGTVPLVGRQWKNAVVETAAYYQTYHPDEIDTDGFINGCMPLIPVSKRKETNHG